MNVNRAGMSSETAKAISNELLRVTGEAYFSGDFERFSECFSLPQWVETYEGKRLLKSRDDLLDLFRKVRTRFREAGVTNLERHCTEAEFADEYTINATHVSRLMQGDQLYRRPYPSFSELRWIDGRWRVARSIYAITDDHTHGDALTGGGGQEPNAAGEVLPEVHASQPNETPSA